MPSTKKLYRCGGKCCGRFSFWQTHAISFFTQHYWFSSQLILFSDAIFHCVCNFQLRFPNFCSGFMNKGVCQFSFPQFRLSAYFSLLVLRNAVDGVGARSWLINRKTANSCSWYLMAGGTQMTECEFSFAENRPAESGSNSQVRQVDRALSNFTSAERKIVWGYVENGQSLRSASDGVYGCVAAEFSPLRCVCVVVILCTHGVFYMRKLYGNRRDIYV